MSFSVLRNGERFSGPKFYATRCVPFNLAQDFIDTYQFVRQPGFYKVWPDWKQLVSKYFSNDAGLFVDLCKSNIDLSEFHFRFSQDANGRAYMLASAVKTNVRYWKGFNKENFRNVLGEILHCNRLFYPGDFSLDEDGFETTCNCVDEFHTCQAIKMTVEETLKLIGGIRDAIKESWYEAIQKANPIYSNCEFRHYHKIVLYGSLIVALAKKSKRSMKRYLYKLLRMIYSMDPARINWEDIEILIFKAPSILPRNILTYVYNNHYCEKFTENTKYDIINYFESNKFNRVNIVQQCSTSQSVSATPFHELAKIVSKFPEQQIGCTVIHKIPEAERDELFARFEATLLKTQEQFMQSMRDSLTEISHYALTLFIITATIALLGYSIARLGERIVMATLNLIYKLLCGNFSEDLEIKQQNGGYSIPLLPTMVIKNIISPPSDVMEKIWNNPQVDKVMRRIGYLGDPKIQKGVTTIADWMKDMIVSTINWFSREVLGIEIPEDIERKCSPLESWYEDCDDFIKTYWNQTLEWNDSTWAVLMSLYSRGTAFVRQRLYEPYKQDIYKVLFRLGNILEKFNVHGRAGATARNAPVMIYLCGDTGVGKSSITYPISAESLKKIFKKEGTEFDLVKNWKRLVYMRAPEQVYWDGYENQLVTVYDDYGQMVDSSGNPNPEHFEGVRCGNVFPYNLHMADLSQKANTTFTSKIVIFSSNMQQPKTASLNFPEALFRRFDLCLKVTRKPGVVVVPGQFNPDIYTFQRYDMSTQAPGEFISYEDVIQFTVDQYFRRKGFVESMDEYITRKLSEEDPEQQGLGTFVGNCVNASKMGVKRVVNSVYDGYIDMKMAITGDKFHREMLHLQEEIRKLKEKVPRISVQWSDLQTASSYFMKAIRFIGLASLVIGLLKVFVSFIASSKEKKVMSMTQFIKDTDLPKTCSEKDVKNIVRKTEKLNYVLDPSYKYRLAFAGYPLKGISTKWNYELNKPSAEQDWIDSKGILHPEIRTLEDFLGKNTISEGYNPPIVGPVRVEKGYSEAVVKPIMVESYTEVKAQQLKAEGILFNEKCPHQFAQEYPTNILFSRTLLKSCDDDCPMKIESEGVKDVNANEILGKLIKHNYYKIYMSHNDEAIGHGMFLRGRIFMCPRHYVNVFKQLGEIGGKIYFRNVFLQRSFEVHAQDIIETCEFLESPDEDGAPLSRDIMGFPVKAATFHANIEPFFASKVGVSLLLKSQVVLPVLMEGEGKNPLPFIGFHFTRGQSGLTVKEHAVIRDDIGNPVRQMRDLWEYSMDTKPTFCGAPLIVRNPMVAPGKIIGMHVAGIVNTGLGFSTPVYKEDVTKILKMFSKFDTTEFRPELKMDEYPKEQAQVPLSAEFIRMGSVSRGVSQPGKSKIIPSPIYNKIREPLTKPCSLRPTIVNGELFDPRTYRLGRLGNFPTAISDKLVNYAKRAVIDELASQIPRVELGPNIKPVYSFEEAVVGIDGEPYINSIKRNTSPGYPYVHMTGFSNRKEIFGDEEKCDLNRPQAQILQRRVEKILNLAGRGVAIEHVFMDTLKDERKPIYKAHRTRLFSAGPIDYLIACKQYFNGIVAVLQKSRNICHISVGTDHNTNDWGQIVKELMRKSHEMVAGDFEGFDASQSMPLLEAAADILIELSKIFCGTSEEDAQIMKVLLIGLFNSVHVTDKEIYQWTHSLPSGHYLTAIINSIFVLLVFCICWMLAIGKTTYMTARSFFKRCGIVAYGDDHVISVPVSYTEVFNQLLIPEYMATIGLSYTMEDKERQVDVKTRPITDITYLKRSFVFDVDRQRWIAPITLDTILESPMWLHKCPDKVSQMIAQLDNQLRELCLHDKPTWEKWSSVFADLGKQFGHYTEYVCQEETRAEVLSD
jgi:hypothetical protein